MRVVSSRHQKTNLLIGERGKNAKRQWNLCFIINNFCSKNGIILVALFPNAALLLQPLDVAVFGTMKAKGNTFWRQWRIDHEGQEKN